MNAMISGAQIARAIVNGTAGIAKRTIVSVTKAVLGNNTEKQVAKDDTAGAGKGSENDSKRDTATPKTEQEKQAARNAAVLAALGFTNPKDLQKTLTSNPAEVAKNYGLDGNPEAKRASSSSPDPTAQANAAGVASPAAPGGAFGGGGPGGGWSGAGAQPHSHGGGYNGGGVHPGTGPIHNPPPEHNHNSIASIVAERNAVVAAYGGEVQSTPSGTWPKTVSITSMDQKGLAELRRVNEEFGEFREKNNLAALNVSETLKYNKDGTVDITVTLDREKPQSQELASTDQQQEAENQRQQQEAQKQSFAERDQGTQVA